MMLRFPCALQWFALAAAVTLAGCAATPPERAGTGASVPGVVARSGPAPSSERDGPEANPPANLETVPDAEPRIEAVRAGGPNKPYDALGRNYVPFTDDRVFVERGLASWYGKKFQGRRTASGELYNMYAMTAAHPTLPIPSYARVRNPANGREVVVRINDRGPFHPGRIIDLSYTAALQLDVLRGVAPVEVERITPADIRSGAWQRGEKVALKAQRDAATAAAVPALPSPPSPAPIAAVAQPTDTPPATATPIAPANAAALSNLSQQPDARDQATAVAPQVPPVTTVPDAPAQVAYTPTARGYWVQIGAFRDRSGAETFQRRVADELDWLAPLLAIFDDQKLHRLQAGPYPSRSEAGSALDRIGQALQLKPVIVERR